MTLRHCIYKNCENFINLKDRSENKGFTLFSFPKNRERRQKWIEYGQPLPDLPPSMHYFCSEHFDKKFLGVNNRRTILVGEAVPFPYIEPEVTEHIQADSNLEYYFDEINKDNHSEDNQETQHDQYLHVESTTTIQEDGVNENKQNDYCMIKLCHNNSKTSLMTKENVKRQKINEENDIIQLEPSSLKVYNKVFASSKNASNNSTDKTVQFINLKDLNAATTTNLDEFNEGIYEEHISNDLEELEDDYTQVVNKGMDIKHKSPYKRMFGDNDLTEAPLSKAKIPKTSPAMKIIEKSQVTYDEETIAIENKETEAEEINLEENLFDAKHISTFIFKGEEYVQMRKDFYLQEKMEITKKFQKMLRTVKAIKEYINKLDI